jgi:hypothetical protein
MAGEIPNPSGSAAMPLTDVMHLISVDDHLVEPPSLWAERLPAKFREAGGTEPMRQIVETNSRELFRFPRNA